MVQLVIKLAGKSFRIREIGESIIGFIWGSRDLIAKCRATRSTCMDWNLSDLPGKLLLRISDVFFVARLNLAFVNFERMSGAQILLADARLRPLSYYSTKKSKMTLCCKVLKE